MKQKVDTLIVSDLHIGSELFQSKKLKDTLQKFEFKKLILLGDIFQDLNFKRLRKTEWKFLSFLRKLTDPTNGIEVIWVEGNHDFEVMHVISFFLGIDIYEEYEWEENGKKYLAMHGHQFHLRLPKSRFWNNLGSEIYLLFQKIEGKKKRITHFLNNFFDKISESRKYVAEGALIHAETKDVDYMICGHTHEPEVRNKILSVNPIKEIFYFNTGSWVVDNPSFITIIDGMATLNYYDKH